MRKCSVPKRPRVAMLMAAKVALQTTNITASTSMRVVATQVAARASTGMEAKEAKARERAAIIATIPMIKRQASSLVRSPLSSRILNP